MGCCHGKGKRRISPDITICVIIWVSSDVGKFEKVCVTRALSLYWGFLSSGMNKLTRRECGAYYCLGCVLGDGGPLTGYALAFEGTDSRNRGRGVATSPLDHLQYEHVSRLTLDAWRSNLPISRLVKTRKPNTHIFSCLHASEDGVPKK